MNENFRPFADISDEPLLNIKAVSQATGVEAVTLRAWERRYGVPSPERSEQGYRLYSERDIAILRWLKSRIDAGVTIGQAASMLESQSPQAAPQATPLSVLSGEGGSLKTMSDDLLAAAHQFDMTHADQIISQAFAMFPVEDVCLHLLLPALGQVGNNWRSGDTSLAVEHFLSNLIRQHLLSIATVMPPPTREGRVVAGCAPDDWHEMAILMLTLFLRRQGWEVIYLGQAVGLKQLEAELDSINPDLVILSASAYQSIGNLRPAAEVVAGVNEGHIWFLFGGALFPYVPELIDHIPGIYAGDTLTEAMERINGLLNGQWHPAPNVPRAISGPIQRVEAAISQHFPELKAHVAEALRRAEPDLEVGADSVAAEEAMRGLLASLQVGAPEMLRAPEPLAGAALHSWGVSTEDLHDVFERNLDSDLLDALSPYLINL